MLENVSAWSRKGAESRAAAMRKSLRNKGIEDLSGPVPNKEIRKKCGEA
jgi:hypothetical protein